MKYKGYEIMPVEKRGPVSAVTGYGIYAGDRLLSIAMTQVLAKRAIDAHTASGIWEDRAKEE